MIAERNDPYLQQHPEKREVELIKENKNKGKYLMPELYDQPDEKSIFIKQDKAKQIRKGKVKNNENVRKTNE